MEHRMDCSGRAATRLRFPRRLFRCESMRLGKRLIPAPQNRARLLFITLLTGAGPGHDGNNDAGSCVPPEGFSSAYGERGRGAASAGRRPEILHESAHAHTYCAIHQHAARVGEPGGICRSAATRSAMVETNCRGNLQTSLEGPHFAVEARWKRCGRHGGEPSRPDRGGSRAGDFSDSGGALRPLSGDDHRRARGKKELLRHSGMLEFIDASDSMASIGGLDNLKGWLAQRRGAWEDAAREFGLEPPRGVIILGVQGCGKSMCARAIAGEWKLPLVKFDTAAVYDKYIGETQKRIQKVFQVAEGLAPCVLWIDELEKVLAGSGPDSASVDAGVSSRILAAFLGWMQERKAPVFVAATCNNVTALPPELIRKGRFDELFFLDLPNQSERKQIFAIQLNRRKRNPSEFDLDRIAAAAKGYSGAEIDAAVQTALYAAYSSKQPLSVQALLDALKGTVPLSTTRAEDIQALREWARTRAVPASVADARGEGHNVCNGSPRPIPD